MITADKLIERYSADNSPRKVFVFEKTTEDGSIQYGCRYYENQIFKYDEIFYDLTPNEVAKIAMDWIKEPLK